MEKILSSISSPKDVKKLDVRELNILAKEIREFLINRLSKTGGHLASNLGVVELTLALHYCYNSPTDKIIWDVGHQSYVHKILTGRKDKFDSLRKTDGLSGFPKINESPYDAFGTGHSATSISSALGIAAARDLQKDDYKVVAVIGDGSMTGGMAFEALNYAGQINTDLTVILNDNEMSISQNVGGLSKYLNRVRLDKKYLTAKKGIEKILGNIPLIGKTSVKAVRRFKESVRTFFVQGGLFEGLGFTYIGPVDGHNTEELLQVLSKSRNIKGPILIHVKTKKGKGYSFAEKQPEKYHGISPFEPKTGNVKNIKKANSYSGVFGHALTKLAYKDEKLVGITAAMPRGTGLSVFAKKHPTKFFDVGIAEQHAVTFAAGLAVQGYKPVVSIYSTFLQRAYDQVLHDVCIQNLPVVLIIDRAGIVGADGPTHHGVFDIAYLSPIPNMTIMAPKNYKELSVMLEFAVNYNRPIAIRYPRGSEGLNVSSQSAPSIEYGKSEIIKEGSKVAIVAIGNMVELAMEVSNILSDKGLDPYIINARFVKPMDIEVLESLASDIDNIVTIEDHVLNGGFGQQLLVKLKQNELFDEINIKNFGFPDTFVEHGDVKDIYKKYSLDSKSIARYIYDNCKNN